MTDKRGIDLALFIPIILLLSLSLVMLASVAPDLAGQQLVSSVLGLLCFFVISRIDIRVWEPLGKFFWIVSVLLLVVTALIGVSSRGSVRWLEFLGTRIQTAEIVKPLLLLFFASFLKKHPPTSVKSLFLLCTALLIPTFLVFRQPDLGTALVMMAIFCGMLFVSWVPVKMIVAGALFLGLLLPAGWNYLADYQRLRIASFLDPTRDPLGSGYSSIQSIIAVGSGQLLGRGLGRGVQSQLKFLPEHYTDFIFASLAEELGFIGAIALIAIYGVLLARCFWIASSCRSIFGRLIASGVFVMLLFQILVNIGMNMGLVPITGITLPFVSYGGSSVVALCVSLGLVAAVRRKSSGLPFDRQHED